LKKNGPASTPGFFDPTPISEEFKESMFWMRLLHKNAPKEINEEAPTSSQDKDFTG